jgi:hypothetical protein
MPLFDCIRGNMIDVSHLALVYGRNTNLLALEELRKALVIPHKSWAYVFLIPRIHIALFHFSPVSNEPIRLQLYEFIPCFIEIPRARYSRFLCDTDSAALAARPRDPYALDDRRELVLNLDVRKTIAEAFPRQTKMRNREGVDGLPLDP